MTIKDILVPVNHSPDASHHLDAASKLAEMFDAHLTGLHVNTVPSYEVYGEVMTPGIIEAIENQQQVNSGLARQAFEKSNTGRLDKTTFFSMQGHAAQELVRHAANQDMVVVGQVNPDTYTDITSNIPEQVALESGRPALVIPYIGCRDTLGENILVAWNNKKEAVRAVHDAMPLLIRAKTVKVLAVNTGKKEAVFCGDIGEHLARHNVNVEVQQMEKSDINVGDNLLSRVSDFGSDMLVMGAYGHSRFREYTLGGVTRSILKTMTVPVLLSH